MLLLNDGQSTSKCHIYPTERLHLIDNTMIGCKHYQEPVNLQSYKRILVDTMNTRIQMSTHFCCCKIQLDTVQVLMNLLYSNVQQDTIVGKVPDTPHRHIPLDMVYTVPDLSEQQKNQVRRVRVRAILQGKSVPSDKYLQS